MPTGVYPRTPCAAACGCRKHIRRERSEQTRLAMSRAAKARGFTHVTDCSCGWCARRGQRALNPTYRAIHARLDRERGKPSLCAHCGSTEAKRYDWAFTGDGHLDSQGQPYSDDLTQYVRLCRSCHRRFDKGGE